MHRLVPIVSLGALGLSALLTGACGFSSAGISCDVQSGSATVSSPTGVYGPPDIAGVNRAYNLRGSCSTSPANSSDVTVSDLSVYAEYHPAEHEAREEIRGARGLEARSTWSCDLDPWIAADAHCTRGSVTGVYPKDSEYLFTGEMPLPLSAYYLTGEARDNVQLRLIADYKDKAALYPNPCLGEAEFTSQLLQPAEGQQVSFPDSVYLDVLRGAADGCTAAIDGVQPIFDVEWEHADAGGQYTIEPIVARFDGTATPNGILIPYATFAQFHTPDVANRWRVRVRLSLQPDAVWSDWVNFTLVDTSQP